MLIFTLGAIGGAERMAITIGKLLPTSSYHVKFVVLGDNYKIMDFMPKGYDVNKLSYNTKSIASIVRIWWTIKKEKPNIVFGTQARINPQVTIASRLAGRKVLIRSSGMLSDYKGLKFLMAKWFYPLADVIIAQQEEMRIEIAELCNIKPNKIVTLHNVLDIDNIDAMIRVPSPFPQQQVYNFVNVARLSSVKGHEIAIKAMAIVRRSIPNSHLYFIGPLDNQVLYSDLLKMVSKLHLDNYVHFVGYDSNPYRWVKYCDCFVFPSRSEGLPNALIEASYIGVPCVASMCLEIVGDIIKDGYNGYTTKVGDVEEFACGMMKAIKLKNFEMVYKPSSKESFVDLFNSLI